MPYETRDYTEIFFEYINRKCGVQIDDLSYCDLLYDPYMKEFRRYNYGVYEVQTDQDIARLFYQAMEEGQCANTLNRKRHCIDLLKVEYQYKGDWMDNDPNYDCVLNGIVDLQSRELLPHHPDCHFKHQIKRNYFPDVDPIIPEKFNECLKAIKDKYDRENYLKFWISVVHKKHEYESFLICYGPKGSGKSSNLGIFPAMYGEDVTAKKPLNLIGRRFGLSNIYTKRINIHPDMPVVDLDPFTISVLKNITGNDGGIDVEIKGLTPITYKIMLFLAFGIQQLPGFNQHAEKEIDSIMRRVVLVDFPETQKINRKFKKDLLAPDFLDQLYSWLVYMRPVPFFEDDKMDEWIQYNKKKWLRNADPVLRILEDNFVYEDKHTTKAFDVIQLVRAELEADGMLVPSRLKTQITNAFSAMNIHSNGKRGTNCLYENCRQIDPEELFLQELYDEVNNQNE